MSRWLPLPGWAVAFLRLTMRVQGEAPPLFPDVAIEHLERAGMLGMPVLQLQEVAADRPIELSGM